MRLSLKPHLSILSPAKINLHLHVGHRTPDGYHQIISLFQAIALRDTVQLRCSGQTVSVQADRTEIAVHGTFSCKTEQNLIYRACQAYLQKLRQYDPKFEVPARLEFDVAKRIPEQAGLGGGSSNAATAFRLMQRALGAPLGQSDLQELAETLGSDIPFFLYGGLAWGTGRGNQILKEPKADEITGILSRLRLLIVKLEGSSSSTGQMYGLLQRQACPDLYPHPWQPEHYFTDERIRRLQRAYRHRTELFPDFTNDFQKVLSKKCSSLATLEHSLYNSAALCAGLCGSGSAYYAFFAKQSDLERVRAELAETFAEQILFWETEVLTETPTSQQFWTSASG